MDRTTALRTWHTAEAAKVRTAYSPCSHTKTDNGHCVRCGRKNTP
jgi:hypothetical protein